MADEDKKKSFWETSPIVITALAALIGSIAALIAALNGGGEEKSAKPDPPAAVQISPAKTSAADDATQQMTLTPKQGEIMIDIGVTQLRKD